ASSLQLFRLDARPRLTLLPHTADQPRVLTQFCHKSGSSTTATSKVLGGRIIRESRRRAGACPRGCRPLAQAFVTPASGGGHAPALHGPGRVEAFVNSPA